MRDEAQAQDWKDPESRDEPAADHPSGQIRLRQYAGAGVRVALLMGVVALGGAGDVPDTVMTSLHPTISVM